MNSKEVYERYNELIKLDKFECNDQELQDFVISGLILQIGDSYKLRDKPSFPINIIKTTIHEFDLDLSCILSFKDDITNKVFYMSDDRRAMYKDQGLVIEKNKKEYYRLYANELWLIKII